MTCKARNRSKFGVKWTKKLHLNLNWFPVSLAACSWVAWRFQPGSIKWLFLISHVWASVHTLHETYQHTQTKMCNESQSKKQCSAQLHHPHWSKESRPCLQVADQTWKSFSFNKPIANCSSSNYHDSHSDGTFLTSTTSAAYSVHVVLVWNGQMVHVCPCPLKDSENASFLKYWSMLTVSSCVNVQPAFPKPHSISLHMGSVSMIDSL